jgi:hypothetical protein
MTASAMALQDGARPITTPVPRVRIETKLGIDRASPAANRPPTGIDAPGPASVQEKAA